MPKALAVATDVTRPGVRRRLLSQGRARFGRIDIVVNNAGVCCRRRSSILDPADLQRMLDVNLFGALHVMQAAVKQMRASRPVVTS